MFSVYFKKKNAFSRLKYLEREREREREILTTVYAKLM
jgi:hypothetical protein